MNHNAIWTELTDKYINYTPKKYFRLNQVEITLEGNNCRLPIVAVYQSKVKNIFLSYVSYVHQGCIYLINNRVMLLLFIYLFNCFLVQQVAEFARSLKKSNQTKKGLSKTYIYIFSICKSEHEDEHEHWRNHGLKRLLLGLILIHFCHLFTFAYGK